MSNREYPERPLVGVGGVVIEGGRVLLVRRGTEPLRGQWSIPGGLLESGETLVQGVARELHEETGLIVRVVELIEALERIFPEPAPGQVLDPESDSVRTAKHASPDDLPAGVPAQIRRLPARPQYHYVILDYLCERVSGHARPGGDVTQAKFVSEADLPDYSLSPITLRVLEKAFVLSRAQQARQP
jgi:8-oxo-dGTP diphosphatase